MELRQYWELLKKWLWLILLTTVIAALTTFFISSRQTPIYRATSRLLVSQGVNNNRASQYADILAAERLSSTYAQMLKARPTLKAAIKKAGLEDTITVDDLKGAISVQPVRDTQLIDIAVEYKVRSIAAKMANALPDAFVEFVNEQQTARFKESKQALQQQLQLLDQENQSTEAALQELASQTGVDVNARRSLLEDRLTQYRSSYSNVLAQLENIRLYEANALDTVTVVEPATIPDRPVRPRVLMNTLLAAIIGGMIGLGAAFLIEYLDDTVKSPDDITRIANLSTLGIIARTKNEEGSSNIMTLEAPRSPVAEAYRTIRTAIQFAGVDKPMRTLVVTSAGPSEGKSTTVANLAVVMAQTGKRTILVDADLRKPTQHKRWSIPNTTGLTGALLMDEIEDDLDYLLSPTPVDNLWVMTSGQLPHNPSELLGSHKLKQLIERLLQDYDILLFDSPPALAVTDPVVLGREMDGVIIVIDAGTTREPALAHIVSEMQRVQAHIVGVVLNRFRRRSDSGYYYYYYNRYYQEDNTPEGKGGTRRKRTSHHHQTQQKGWFSRQISRLNH